MRLYLAAPWSQRDQARIMSQKLMEAGHIVTATWFNQEPTDDPAMLREFALRDIEELFSANMLILINSQKRGEETSGKAVETGLAIATLKGIIIVGERSNIFHYLNMPIVDSIEEALKELQGWVPIEYSHPFGNMPAAVRGSLDSPHAPEAVPVS